MTDSFELDHAGNDKSESRNRHGKRAPFKGLLQICSNVAEHYKKVTHQMSQFAVSSNVSEARGHRNPQCTSSIPELNKMFRTGLNAAVIVLAIGATQAHAKLSMVTIPTLDEAAHTALHKPTGCQARIVMRGDTFLEAQIIDPQCLPKGVKARNIPGTLFDFLVTPK